MSVIQTVPITGTSDDTAAVQAAINTFRTTGAPVQLPIGPCKISSLDMTNTSGIIFRGCGMKSPIIPITNGANVIDLVGANNPCLRDIHIGGAVNPSITPATGILIGQKSGSYVADTHFFDNVRVDGYFNLAAFFNLAVASSSMRNCQFYNYLTGAITAILTGNNFFGAASTHTTIDNSNTHVPSDWTFSQVEFHNVIANNALWIGGASSHRFYGGNISVANTASPVSYNSVVIGGVTTPPKDIFFDGTTFYSDATPLPATAVLNNAGTTYAPTFRANDCAFPLI